MTIIKNITSEADKEVTELILQFHEYSKNPTVAGFYDVCSLLAKIKSHLAMLSELTGVPYPERVSLINQN